jgi:uncharacterized protein
VLHFEWDPVKAQTNHRKHGVSFDDGIRVFEDPNSVSQPDRVDDRGEMRWHVIGTIGYSTLLLVVHTVREHGLDEVVRIISARGANRKERRLYEQTRAQNAG